MDRGKITVIAVPALQDNLIWALSDRNSAIVIDPGEAVPVYAWLEQQNLTLEAVLLTHHHGDHCAGVADLVAYSSKRGGQVQVFGPFVEDIAGVTHPLEQEGLLILDNKAFAFEVIMVPGHTRGHVAYLYKEAEGGWHLFCGDTLFGAGCGRLFEGTPQQMWSSLQKIRDLPATTWVHCAHEYTEANLRFALEVEPENLRIIERMTKVRELRKQGLWSVPFLLSEELETNPFLRCHFSEVVETALQRGAISSRPEDVFSALRAWRNVF